MKDNTKIDFKNNETIKHLLSKPLNDWTVGDLVVIFKESNIEPKAAVWKSNPNTLIKDCLSTEAFNKFDSLREYLKSQVEN